MAEIAAEVNGGGRKPISVTPMKRRLGKAGLRGRLSAQKTWTIEDWKRVLWNNETMFKVYGFRRHVFVRREAGERASDRSIVPTVKHRGGSVMVY
ncbi:hypothetical protein Trydic_g16581 [Trypoxylus dichotomus]